MTYMERTALILGGGDGTRMRPLSSTKPKAMLPVCGVPLIGYIFGNLRACGYTEIIIAADRFSNQIVEYLEGKGIENKSGKTKWSKATIQNMLSNEKYVGDMLMQKTFRT